MRELIFSASCAGLVIRGGPTGCAHRHADGTGLECGYPEQHALHLPCSWGNLNTQYHVFAHRFEPIQRERQRAHSSKAVRPLTDHPERVPQPDSTQRMHSKHKGE